MTPTIFAAFAGLLSGAAMILGGEALSRARVERGLLLVTPMAGESFRTKDALRSRGSGAVARGLPRRLMSGGGSVAWLGLLGPPAGFVGWVFAGPAGLILGIALAGSTPRVLKRRRLAELGTKLERQLADVVESCSLAVRAGLSIVQSLEFAANEAEAPMHELLWRVLEEQRVGAPFDIALQHFGEVLATEDAHLFVLVVTTHARSGGNLAGALDEVATTIRHRIEVRRELRALSAQGRVSGAILGSLPIAFFLVLAGTSHRELGPVYRSPAGIAMVSAGLVMEAAAYVWIRRLMRVEA